VRNHTDPSAHHLLNFPLFTSLRPRRPHTHEKLQSCKVATLLNDSRTSATSRREKLLEKLPWSQHRRRNSTGLPDPEKIEIIEKRA
jgi:hypothetical protein